MNGRIKITHSPKQIQDAINKLLTEAISIDLPDLMVSGNLECFDVVVGANLYGEDCVIAWVEELDPCNVHLHNYLVGNLAKQGINNVSFIFEW